VPSSGEVIAEYLAHLERKGYSAGTCEAARHWLVHLQDRAGDPLGLTAAELTEYEQSLRWQPHARGRLYSENSVNQAVDTVRRFYRWAVESGHLRKSPAAHLLTRRVPARGRRELSTEEARKLLAGPNRKTFHGLRDRAILGLIIEHRLAYRVLSNLDLGHFHYDTAALLTSGRKRGILSLSDGLAEDIQHYLTQARPAVAKVNEPALFVSRQGSRMTDVSFRTILDRHAQAADLTRIRFPL
jgi:integrase/recombinase XerD